MATAIAKQLHAGVTSVYNTVTIADGDEDAGDILQMVKIPKGARIIDVTVATTDVDTSTGIAFTVGDTDGTDDTDRYITSSTIGQTGGVARMNNEAGLGYVFEADGTIDVTFTVAATTFAAGTVRLWALYALDSVTYSLGATA